MNIDDKLIREIAKKYVMRKLYLKPQPVSIRVIDGMVEKVLNCIVKKYGATSNVRDRMEGNDLLPAIQESYNELYNKTRK